MRSVTGKCELHADSRYHVVLRETSRRSLPRGTLERKPCVSYAVHILLLHPDRASCLRKSVTLWSIAAQENFENSPPRAEPPPSLDWSAAATAITLRLFSSAVKVHNRIRTAYRRELSNRKCGPASGVSFSSVAGAASGAEPHRLFFVD